MFLQKGQSAYKPRGLCLRKKVFQRTFEAEKSDAIPKLMQPISCQLLDRGTEEREQLVSGKMEIQWCGDGSLGGDGASQEQG